MDKPTTKLFDREVEMRSAGEPKNRIYTTWLIKRTDKSQIPGTRRYLRSVDEIPMIVTSWATVIPFSDDEAVCHADHLRTVISYIKDLSAEMARQAAGYSHMNAFLITNF